MSSLAMAAPERTLAIALHDVEPATFDRCAQIREWLDERGVDRATLLVIPARDLHPLAERSPELVAWLLGRRSAGDSIAQHGFQDQAGHRRHSTHRRGIGLGRTGAEFTDLDARETRRAVQAGWRVLKLGGIEPDGFVAPGYAYTHALRNVLRERYQWWVELFGVHRVAVGPEPLARVRQAAIRPGNALQRAHDMRAARRTIMPPPLVPASPARLRGGLSRALARAEDRIETLMPCATLRLDVHPHDFDRPSRVTALERLLLAVGEGRRAITYDELALGAPALPVTASRIYGRHGAATGPARGTPRAA